MRKLTTLGTLFADLSPERLWATWGTAVRWDLKKILGRILALGRVLWVTLEEGELKMLWARPWSPSPGWRRGQVTHQPAQWLQWTEFCRKMSLASQKRLEVPWQLKARRKARLKYPEKALLRSMGTEEGALIEGVEEQGLSQAAPGWDRLGRTGQTGATYRLRDRAHSGSKGQGTWWFCGMPRRPNPGACLLPPHSRPGMLGTWGPAPEHSVLSHCPESSPREVCPRAWPLSSSSSSQAPTWQD